MPSIYKCLMFEHQSSEFWETKNNLFRWIGRKDQIHVWNRIKRNKISQVQKQSADTNLTENLFDSWTIYEMRNLCRCFYCCNFIQHQWCYIKHRHIQFAYRFNVKWSDSIVLLLILFNFSIVCHAFHLQSSTVVRLVAADVFFELLYSFIFLLATFIIIIKITFFQIYLKFISFFLHSATMN